MKRIFLLLILILASSILIPGQSTPTQRGETERQKRDRLFDQRVNDMRNADKRRVIEDPAGYLRFLETKIKPLYREPTREEQELLAPNQEDLTKYAEFLKQKNTGLTRLIIDRGCDERADVIVSKPHCTKYTMPGAGSSYSFREDTYRWRHLADLTYSDNHLQTMGVLVQGIFVDIGNVPLEEMTLKTPGVKFLDEFEPSEDIDEVAKFNEELAGGIEKDNFTYRKSLPIYDNTTYVMRAVAYRGIAPRTVESVTYNEFEFDKRKDVIVALRIIRYESNHSITIVWKRLDMRKSPEMVLGEK